MTFWSPDQHYLIVIFLSLALWKSLEFFNTVGFTPHNIYTEYAIPGCYCVYAIMVDTRNYFVYQLYLGKLYAIEDFQTSDHHFCSLWKQLPPVLSVSTWLRQRHVYKILANRGTMDANVSLIIDKVIFLVNTVNLLVQL